MAGQPCAEPVQSLARAWVDGENNHLIEGVERVYQRLEAQRVVGGGGSMHRQQGISTRLKLEALHYAGFSARKGAESHQGVEHDVAHPIAGVPVSLNLQVLQGGAADTKVQVGDA